MPTPASRNLLSRDLLSLQIPKVPSNVSLASVSQILHWEKFPGIFISSLALKSSKYLTVRGFQEWLIPKQGWDEVLLPFQICPSLWNFQLRIFHDPKGILGFWESQRGAGRAQIQNLCLDTVNFIPSILLSAETTTRISVTPCPLPAQISFTCLYPDSCILEKF